MNVKELLSKGESETVEFKRSLSDINRIIETIVAFANTRGGRILVGVKDGEIFGIEIGRDSIEKLTQRIVAITDPKIYPEILVQDIDKRKVVIIKVNESKNKPHLAFNKAFKRVGKSTVQLSRDELEKLILDKYKEKITFDLQLSEADFTELDKNKIRDFVSTANRERNLRIRFTNVKDVLDKLGLLRRKKLLNPTVLLFSENPQKYFSQAEVRCARFRGKETTEFIDMKVFSGTLDEQIENALGFVMNHVKRRIKIEGAKRKEEWEYPISAVREAITNAVCHRDYFSTANVQVS
ncbi:MAG: putative DNA binding domain-containing protein, partial [Elusimicrobiota bacterium]|nr:putative DNA binding domain-containing protein [Elusimicrobiota bacterium]